MRGSLLMAVVAGLVASTPATASSKPRSSPQPRRLYTSADDERKAMAQAKRDRKAAKRAAQKGEALTTDNWETITETRPAQGVAVLTKIDGAGGPRNKQALVRKENLWFFPDMSTYVCYTPTHFKEQPNDR